MLDLARRTDENSNRPPREPSCQRLHFMQVLIVDDHPLLREGVGLLLGQFDSNLQAAGAGSLGEALALAGSIESLGLILLDLDLPDVDGFGGLAAIRKACPGVPVVILSADQDPATIVACIDRGAMGYVTKSSSTDVFRAAMRLIASGNVYIPPDALRLLSHDHGGPSPGLSLEQALSPREMQVLRALIQGASNKLIARQMGISEPTVKFHVSNLLKRLRVQNRTQAVIAAARAGVRLDMSVRATADRARQMAPPPDEPSTGPARSPRGG